MFLLIWFGKQFGMSSTLRTMCSMGGAGKRYPYFNFDWQDQIWNIVVAGGALFGGWLASYALKSPEPVQITEGTIHHLAQMGISTPKTLAEGSGFFPNELLNFDTLFTVKGFLLLVGGGFLIGFGTRWAGGCTSGHAISGLSNLQFPSLIAVIGFFIGGLITTHFLLPALLGL